jgi:ion channel POLLUX/CASTOR
MKPTIRFTDRLRYAIDNTFSRGMGALILWLGILSVLIIGFMALVVSWLKIAPAGEEPLRFGEAFWRSLMRTLDAGTMGSDSGWGFRLAMLIVTIGGVFVISTLIGILSSAIEAKLEDLRKGRSRVLESNHTVILGWTDQVYTIVSELVEANSNQKSSNITILGERDKVEMEELLQERLGRTKKTRIVCRSGSAMEMSDLSMVSINTSKSIIVLSPDGSEDPDAEVIKIILAITNHPHRRALPFHIVAELRDSRNLEVAKIVGKDELELVLTGEIISRIIAQTCRQSGLSVVYTELLDFGGDEIYLKTFPGRMNGKCYGELINQFEKNAVMGLVTGDGIARVNPPPSTILSNTDRLILMAEDDDRIFLDGKPEIQEDLIHFGIQAPPEPEKTLILGWNWKALSIIHELDNYVAPGSSVVVMADEPEIEQKLKENTADLQRQIIKFTLGDTTDRRKLEGLDLEAFNHIVILCYSDSLSLQKADARTMITLLHLREMAEKKNLKFSIVSEMLDIRNRNLAEVAHADDFIVSDKIISLLIAQVSENKLLNPVFQDIFDPEGSEFYLKPMSNYITPGKPANFYTVVESARRKNETAIGYRLAKDSRDSEKAYGIHLNPEKSKEVVFDKADKIIVLAE